MPTPCFQDRYASLRPSPLPEGGQAFQGKYVDSPFQPVMPKREK